MVAALNPLWAILDQQLGMNAAKRSVDAIAEATAQVIPLAVSPVTGRLVEPAAVEFPITAAPAIPFSAAARPKITLTPVAPVPVEAPAALAVPPVVPAAVPEPTSQPQAEVEQALAPAASAPQAQDLKTQKPDGVEAGEAKADWARVLDAILVARRKGQQHARQLREQDDAHRQTMHGLQKEILEIRQQSLGPADRVHQMQQEIHGRVRDILKQTEARLQSIQAHADARVRAADERAEQAIKRAEAAEGYLRQLERAARSLTLLEDGIAP